MLETSSQEIIYGDQFTISTQFIEPFYFVIPFPTPTDPAPKFLKKLTPFIQVLLGLCCWNMNGSSEFFASVLFEVKKCFPN